MADEQAPAKALTKNPLGPVGHAVAANVERLRREQNLTFAALSANLEKLGRPIPPLGLRKIVAETRRVDVDDLVGLAVALSTAPASLLMPNLDSAQPDDQIQLVDDAPTTSAQRAWEWITARNRIASMRFSAFADRSWPRWERERYEEDLIAKRERGLEELTGQLWPRERGADGDD